MTTKSIADLYRALPSIDEVLRREGVAQISRHEGRAFVAGAARSVLARLRDEITAGVLDESGVRLAVEGLPAAISLEIANQLAPSLQPVINASGVILHTNLGRAPLSDAALEHVRRVSSRYSNLEFDLASGERGKRDVHVERLFARLLNAERAVSTIVVNNNAAAVMLALNSLAEGGEVIVSRGELVEIGGSFRIPDIMGKSQAVLREVGTTNRTRITDYTNAINERTRLLLRVHRSNFQIVGFTEQPSLDELVRLGREHGIPVMEDLGSGALFDLNAVGIAGEPTISDSLRAGVDVVTYSGDKLLGGPQAGMLSGNPQLISRVRSNPMFRALRVDKMIYAALEATLLDYVRQEYSAIPTLRFLESPAGDVQRRAETMCEKVDAVDGIAVEVVPCNSAIGGGSTPGVTVPSFALSVVVHDMTVDALARELRQGCPPIISRIEEGRLLLDLRTVWPEQDDEIVAALHRLTGR